MATTKMASVNDDAAVIAARKKLTELEQKLEQVTNRPSQAIEDDIRERAELLLGGKPAKPKKEAADEIRVLKRAVGIALENYREAQKKAAEKIIEGAEPDYKKVRAELLAESQRFALVLQLHDDFIQQLWAAGLFDFLPATWSKKAPVVGIFPHGRLDGLIENLKLAT